MATPMATPISAATPIPSNAANMGEEKSEADMSYNVGLPYICGGTFSLCLYLCPSLLSNTLLRFCSASR